MQNRERGGEDRGRLCQCKRFYYYVCPAHVHWHTHAMAFHSTAEPKRNLGMRDTSYRESYRLTPEEEYTYTATAHTHTHIHTEMRWNTKHCWMHAEQPCTALTARPDISRDRDRQRCARQSRESDSWVFDWQDRLLTLGVITEGGPVGVWDEGIREYNREFREEGEESGV